MLREPDGNVVPATVIRNVFLGNSRDYMVELADGAQIRVVTEPQESIAPGTKVSLHAAARALPGAGGVTNCPVGMMSFRSIGLVRARARCGMR